MDLAKKFSLDFSVFINCLLFWCYVYLVFIVFLEIVSLSINFGIVLILTVVSTYIFLWYIAVPKPDNAIVTEILGSDPKFMKHGKSSLVSSTWPNEIGEEKQYFTVIGHRGAGHDAPENSISAFKQCLEKGCRAVEFDLVITADGVPVLFHDDTVDRLTNSTGLVQQMTWDQLKTLDISEKHPLQERFVGERVALFSDTIKLCLDSDMRMIIDIKDDSSKVVQVILTAFRENPDLYKRAIVSAFNPIIIYMIRSHDSRIVCSLAYRPYYFSCSSYGRDVGCVRRYSNLPAHLLARAADIVSTWLLYHVTYYLLGLSAILLHKDYVTSELVSWWQEKKLRVIVWTVNLPQEKHFFSRVMRLAYITDTLASDDLY